MTTVKNPKEHREEQRPMPKTNLSAKHLRELERLEVSTEGRQWLERLSEAAAHVAKLRSDDAIVQMNDVIVEAADMPSIGSDSSVASPASGQMEPRPPRARDPLRTASQSAL